MELPVAGISIVFGTVNFHKNNLVVLTQSVLIVPVLLYVQKGRTPESTNGHETDAFSEDYGCKPEYSW
jgi:hypothetical protein